MVSVRKPSVGVIGLGSMGMGVARTLVKKGFTTHAFDIRASARKAFARAGGVAHGSPAELAAQCNVVIVLVVNAAQTTEVLFGEHGAVAALKPGSVVIASATVAPEFAIDLGERLDDAGVLMIDAPVSGGAARAATGELSIMASGTPSPCISTSRVRTARSAMRWRTTGSRSSPTSFNQVTISSRSLRTRPGGN